MIGCCAASSCLAASPQWVDAVEKVRKCLVTIFSKEAQLNHCRRLNVAPRPLSKSPVSFSLGDEVPHIVIRESHQRPREILISGGKGLFQHHRSKPVNLRASKMSPICP